MLLPPFRGQAMIGELGFTDALDFVIVDNLLRVQNLEKVYAVGDIASFTGPKLAFMAVRQAQVAAENIASEIQGRVPVKTYQHDIALIVDEGGEAGIFLHYGIWQTRLLKSALGRRITYSRNETALIFGLRQVIERMKKAA